MANAEGRPLVDRTAATDAAAVDVHAATSANWFFDTLTARGFAWVVFQIYRFKGDWTHACPRCVNALATTCRSAHIWFYTTFDPLVAVSTGVADGDGEA